MKLDAKIRRHYRTIVLSDIHLGTADCKAAELLEFLKRVSCERLILNGDIIDFWSLKRNAYWRDAHTRVLRQILKMAEKRQTHIVYLRGNHDDISAEFLPILLDKISVRDEYEMEGADGRRYLCVHGDAFDSVTSHMRWLAILGDIGYQQLLKINRFYNRWRAWRGKPYYSLSKAAKQHVKGAVNFICKFEEHLARLALKRGVHGVICGHIHHPEMRRIGEIEYLNSGDWVESLSALAEDFNGRFEVLHYTNFIQQTDTSAPEHPEDESLPRVAVV